MQFCPEPNCGRAGDDLGHCGRHRLPCPRPRELDPNKQVLIRCNLCDRTRVADVGAVMQGKSPISEQCPQAVCAAVVVHPTAPTKPRGKTTDEPPVP